MKLLIQPDDGAGPLIKGIHSTRRSLEIAIFRFDQREIEQALAHAVARGVAVQALIAHTNRAGEDGLRRLELRLLASGITVARTANDLARYHGKFMIIDHHELWVMGFNLTYHDMETSRSFGVVTRSVSLVREAEKLFEADAKRNPYEAGLDTLIVSPANARKQLARFLKGARKQLLVYDPRISDPLMLRLLEERAKAGVDLRIIGKVTRTPKCTVPILRNRLEPVLRQGHVDVVFSGHEHVYERMKPQNGIHYFVLGSSGQLRVRGLKASPEMAKGFDADRAFELVEITGDSLYFQVLSRTGASVDAGVVHKGALPGESLAPSQ